MKLVFIILMIALLAKDILPLGDRYVLRGVSEGLALAVGLGWLITHRVQRFNQQYAITFAYLITLALTALVSQRPLFVIFQVGSLAAVIIFFIAYVKSSDLNPNTLKWNLLAVCCAFVIACIGSLALLASRPDLAFEITPEGKRFRGLFSEPAMMGAVSGLLLGIGTFGSFNKAIRVTATLAAIPCLYMTGSRTSWGAALFALLITGILYIKHKGAWMMGLALAGIIGSIGLVIADVHISTKTQSKVMRSESVGTLSGRTVLWELALKKYQDSPILGFGFTTGSDALAADMGDTLSAAFGVSDRTQQKAFSLHNGYIQALLDSGAIGATLYVLLLGTGIRRLFVNDQDRLHGVEMYGLLFFSISNIADTIIFGAAVFYEVFYWYLSAVALSCVNFRRNEIAYQ